MPEDFGDLGRSRFADELADPRIRDRLIAYTQAEVGGEGQRAQQAFMETIFNRANARGQTLRETLSGPYFPGITHVRAARGVSDATRNEYNPIVDAVLGGSNVANLATGNASGTVGFAGGPQVAAYGRERFGIEGPDRNWWTRLGETAPARPVSLPTAQMVGTGPVPVGTGSVVSTRPKSIADLLAADKPSELDRASTGLAFQVPGAEQIGMFNLVKPNYRGGF